MVRLRGMGQWRAVATMVTVDGAGPPRIDITLVPDSSADGGGDWIVAGDCDWMRDIAEAGGNLRPPMRPSRSFHRPVWR